MAKPKNEFHPIDDRDLMIAPGAGFEAAYLVRKLGCYATVLLIPLSWAAVGAVMIWRQWSFVLWPFGAIPLAAWVILLALPMFIKMRAAVLTTLDAVVTTMEAYLARAGWSIDINQDGRIGHATPEIRPPVEDVRPIIYRGRALLEEHTSGRPMVPAGDLPDKAARVIGDLPDQAEEEPPVRVKVWHLPNKQKIRQEALEYFIDGIFTRGWNRGAWINDKEWIGDKEGDRRKVYDGTMMLLEEARLLEGRKKGFEGRLNVRNARQARAVLDLPAESG